MTFQARDVSICSGHMKYLSKHLFFTLNFAIKPQASKILTESEDPIYLKR